MSRKLWNELSTMLPMMNATRKVIMLGTTPVKVHDQCIKMHYSKNLH
jgi:hypothetical protein